MVVSVKESHIVKPCEDTPNVVMSVSDCDQIHRMSHSLVIYFYRSGNPSIHALKDSLSKALVIFYPVAGRLQWLVGGGGRVEINCNSKGALLLEAESESRVVDYGDFRPTPELRQLIPTVDYANTPLQEQPLLQAQLTRFACGGIALGFALSHILADGESAQHFIGTWARIARGEEPNDFPFLDRKVLQLEHPAVAVDVNHTEFAPPPLLIGKSDNLEELKKPTSLLVLKLSKDNIQKLKDMANEGAPIPGSRSYSRFEVVAAHIWRCATTALGHHSEQPTNSYMTVGFRNRLKPPLPTNYFGNAVLRMAASATSGELQNDSLSYAASRIRQAIDKATNEYLRFNLAFYKQLPDISSYRYYTTNTKVIGNPNLRFTSWASLPLFGIDFGWGKEIYMGPGAVDGDGRVIIIPNHEDDGSLKVLFCFQKEHIDAFENLFYQF